MSKRRLKRAELKKQELKRRAEVKEAREEEDSASMAVFNFFVFGKALPDKIKIQGKCKSLKPRQH